MTHRSNNRGTTVLDRQFRNVGRIRVASGTHDKRMFRKLNDMLTAFHDMGRADLLEAIRDHAVSPLYAFSHYRQGRLDDIPTGSVLAPLGASYDAWRARLECSDEHRKSLKTTRTALGILEEHIVADVPSILIEYRARAIGTPSSFNKARVHFLAFLRDAKSVGNQHQLYREVKAVRSLPAAKPARRAQLSPDEVRRLVVQLGASCGPPCWGMAATGMGPKEFWGEWEEQHDRIHIEGTKRAGRVRDIPRWTTVVRPAISFSHFKRTLRERTEGKVRPYDFRRAFARWLAEAAILEIHRRCYMGHGAKDMTDHYGLGEMVGQLKGDAAKLRAYAGESEQSPLRVDAAIRSPGTPRRLLARQLKVIKRTTRWRARQWLRLANPRGIAQPIAGCDYEML